MEQETSKTAKMENPEAREKKERIPKKIYQLEKCIEREMDLLYAGIDLDD